VLHGPGRHGQRPGGAHGGGPGAPGRAGPGAAGLHRLPRAPVRVLHPGHDDDRPLAAGPPPGPQRDRDPRGHLRPDLPLHRVREHRPVRPLGRRAPAGRPGRRGARAMTSTGQASTGQGSTGPASTGQGSTGPGTPMGYGSMRRKEDARFIRGKGSFIDDLQLRGMLHGAVLRSPYAHARIRSVDTSAAQAHPKVRAVIPGQTLAARDLAWMPTLAGDTQAVLATDKVRFQGQEVAFVVADDRYAARDALELIDVDYEPLPAVMDARRALDDDAPVVRDDLAGPDGTGPRDDNHIFDWETGDAARTDAIFAAADVTIGEDLLYPRVHP